MFTFGKQKLIYRSYFCQIQRQQSSTDFIYFFQVINKRKGNFLLVVIENFLYFCNFFLEKTVELQSNFKNSFNLLTLATPHDFANIKQ